MSSHLIATSQSKKSIMEAKQTLQTESKSSHKPQVSPQQLHKFKQNIITDVDNIINDLGKSGKHLDQGTINAYVELSNALMKASSDKLCEDLQIYSEADAKQFVDNVKLNWQDGNFVTSPE